MKSKQKVRIPKLNEVSSENNKKKHNKDDLQKFHWNEKVGDRGYIRNAQFFSTYLKIKKPFLLNSCKHVHEK